MEKTWKICCEYLFPVDRGGCLYYGFEVVFRGFSHWSMFALGGICMCFAVLAGPGAGVEGSDVDPASALHGFRDVLRVYHRHHRKQVLGWHVWDYTGLPLQLFGQICLPFMLLFALLCGIGIILGGLLLWKVFGEKKPRFFLI